MAVTGRLQPLAFAAVLVLSEAIGPIVGQNFKAKPFAVSFDCLYHRFCAAAHGGLTIRQGHQKSPIIY